MRVHSSTDPVLIYQMLTEQWGLSPPHLVVALVGGDELAQMKPWLRDTVRKGLVKAAQSTGVPHAFINYHTHKNPQTHSHSVFRTVSQQNSIKERTFSIIHWITYFTGAWILTNGLRFGITKQLGQAVRDHSLASTSSKVRVVAIGIAPWNMIHNREALLTSKVTTGIQCSR